MPGCLIPIVGLFFPRALLFFIAILTNWIGRAYESMLWPIIGFFIMPYTTLVYLAAMLNNNHTVTGAWAVFLAFGIILDVLAWGSSRNE